MNSSITYSGNNHNIIGSAISSHKLPGQPSLNIKQRGISISKSNREHKLNIDRPNINNISGIYSSEANNIEDSRRTVTSNGTAGSNQYQAEVNYHYP